MSDVVHGGVEAPQGEVRRVGKVLYCVLSFFLGSFGTYRYLRGQVVCGLFQLLFCWVAPWGMLLLAVKDKQGAVLLCLLFTLIGGIWVFYDFIVSLVKLGQYGDHYLFDEQGEWVPDPSRR